MNIDRAIEPPFYIPDTVNVLYPDQSVTTNGMKLYSVRTDGQEVVRVSLVFRAGTRFQKSPFVASATLNMLSEGTQRWSAQEISEKIDFYGAFLDVSIDRDYAVVTMCCLSKFLPDMLELLEEVVVRPAFSESELEIYKNKRKQQLSIEREKVSFRARERFAEALFGKGHPYGAFYAQEEYDGLTSAALSEFFTSFYNADNCFAVTSGRTTDADLSAIRAFLERLPAGTLSEYEGLPPVNPIPEVYEEREGALQSAVRVGKLMFPRNHPDFIGMQVLLMVLGGYFGSRLVSNLREDKGYTYGVFSTMVNLESSGYMAIATEVGAEFTQDAVREIFFEIRRLREEAVSAEELEMVKNMITGEFMRILDGPFGIADVTIENIQNGSGNDYINRYLQEVKEITPERLKSLAERYLGEEGFVTVVVGKK